MERTIKEQVAELLERNIICVNVINGLPYIGGFDAAAEAIAQLIEARPVGRVQAMALLAGHNVYRSSEFTTVYDIPGLGGIMYRVSHFMHGVDNFISCYQASNHKDCCTVNDKSCEHIKAVKMYLAAKSND